MWTRAVIGVALVALLGVGLAGCGDADGAAETTATATPSTEAAATITTAPEPSVASSGEVSESDRAAISDVLSASAAAEGAGDASAFVALWTDRGLEQYGLNTREEILASGLSSEERPGEPVGEPVVTVSGDDASVTADIVSGIGVYRVQLALVREGEVGSSTVSSSWAPPQHPRVSRWSRSRPSISRSASTGTR